MQLCSYIVVHYKITYIPRMPKTAFDKNFKLINLKINFKYDLNMFSYYSSKKLRAVFKKVEIAENTQNVNSSHASN